MLICGHATWMRRSDLTSLMSLHQVQIVIQHQQHQVKRGKKQRLTTIFSGFSHIKMNECVHPSFWMRREAGIHPGQVVGPSQDTHIAHSHTQLMCCFWEKQRNQGRHVENMPKVVVRKWIRTIPDEVLHHVINEAVCGHHQGHHRWSGRRLKCAQSPNILPNFYRRWWAWGSCLHCRCTATVICSCRAIRRRRSSIPKRALKNTPGLFYSGLHF